MNRATSSATPAPGPGAARARGTAAPRAAFYDPAAYDPERSIGYLMRRVITMLAQDIDRRFEAQGLTHAQWLPLFKLWIGHAQTVAELARACDTDGGATTRMVDRLEAKGLLQRVRSTRDRRVVHLALTPEGRETASRVPIVLSAAQNELLAGFDDREFDALVGALQRLRSNAESRQKVATGDAEAAT